MKITEKWLEEQSACNKGKECFLSQAETGGIKVVEILMETKEKEKLQWANWLIVRLQTKEQNVKYAIFAAEQVLHIFEEKHPEDKRPRQAIESAKEYLKNPTKKNKKAAYTAYDAAYAAAYAACAADAHNKLLTKIIKYGITLLK